MTEQKTQATSPRCPRVKTSRIDWTRSLVALVGIIVSHDGPASPAPNSDTQLWSELDLTTQLAQKVSLTLATEARLSSDLDGPVLYGSGLDVDVAIGNHLTLTPSYYEFLRYRSATNQWLHVHDPIIAATVAGAWRRCDLADRNRFERPHSDITVRSVYRNRLLLDCRLGPEPRRLSLFIWDEVFYFSDYHGWRRNRFASGVDITMSTRLRLQLYYLHQEDKLSAPQTINGAGLTLHLWVGRLN